MARHRRQGRADGEPIIPLDTLLELTANAEADGQKFDGVDLFVAAPHFDIDSDLDAVKRMADHIAGYGLEGRLLRRADLGRRRRRLGDGLAGRAQALPRPRSARPARSASRCASSASARPAASASTPRPRVEAWDKDPKANTKLIAETFREAGDIAADHGEFIVAEGEICWGGMHSWREMREPARRRSAMPGVVGYQADMAHSMLFTLGYNAEKDRILPADFDWSDTAAARRRLQQGRRRAAPLDPRLPRRPERRHRLRLRRPREDRPPLPGRRPERPARYRQARRLLAARRRTAS